MLLIPLLLLVPLGQLAKCEEKLLDPAVRVELDEGNWELMLSGQWLVSFCVPLVPDCLRLQRAWQRFAADMHAEGGSLVVASMRMDYSETLKWRFSIDKLPMLLHVKDGKFRQLPVAYTVGELRQLALSDWKHVPTLPFWKDPNGLVMRMLLCYVGAIEWVHDKGWMLLDYNHSTWLVRIAAVLMLALSGRLVYGICRMFCYMLQMAGWKPHVPEPQVGEPMERASGMAY